MPATLTTTDLLADIRARAGLPSTATLGTDDTTLLAWATDEIRLRLTPDILRHQPEQLTVTEDTTLTAGTASVSIPERAIGKRIARVSFTQVGGQLQPLTLTTLDQLILDGWNMATTGTPRFYYVEGGKVVLYPAPATAGGVLSVSYFLRHSKLVLPTAVGVITSINTGTKTIQHSGLTLPASGSFDLIQANQNPLTLGISRSASGVAPSLTFTSDLPTGLAVSDYVARAGETCVVTLPDEFFSLLAQRVAVRALAGIGDAEGLSAARSELKELEQSLAAILTPAVSKQQPVYVNNALLNLV